MTWHDAKNSWYFFTFLSFFLLLSLVPSYTLYWDRQKRTSFGGFLKNNYFSTYKALETVFTNPFLQVFYAQMKYFFTNCKFQRAFGRCFSKKIYFPTNHMWQSVQCQILLKKGKKEALTVIVSACHSIILIQNFLWTPCYIKKFLFGNQSLFSRPPHTIYLFISKKGTNFLQLMPLGLIIIYYLFLSDCERTLAAKLFVVPEYLLLFITIDAFVSIALPVIFPVFLCDNTLAANDFWIWELLFDLMIFEACVDNFCPLDFLFIFSLFLLERMWPSNILWHLVTYKLFTRLFLGFFTWKAKCFFPNLLSIQAISIFQGNVCCKNHFSLVTFFHAICLLSKRFFSDESEKVWKSSETNTKIHLKDMVLVDDLCLCYFR